MKKSSEYQMGCTGSKEKMDWTVIVWGQFGIQFWVTIMTEIVRFVELIEFVIHVKSKLDRRSMST